MIQPKCHQCASCYAVLRRDNRAPMPWCGERNRPIRPAGCELFEPREDGDSLDLEGEQ